MKLRESYYERLGWRLDFLQRPGPFSWRDRLDYVLPWGSARSVDDLFLRHLRRGPDGSEFFEIERQRFHFKRDEGLPASDVSLRGAVTILSETFASRHSILHPRVSPREGDVVLDLGGNIGTTAMMFARMVGPRGHVFVFEPLFQAPLARNLEANGVRNVTVVPMAVGAEEGEVQFTLTEAGIDSRLANAKMQGTQVLVPMTTVDGFVHRHGLERVDIVKMDIEGAEELALRGALATVERFAPAWTVASYHSDPWGDAQHPKLVTLFRQLGHELEERPGHHIFAWKSG